MRLPSGIEVPQQEIAELCKKWGIRKLELFGSALTGNFTPESDLDLLVTFEEHQPNGFKIFDAMDDFSHLFHREVDLISKENLLRSSNKFKVKRILSNAQLIYERS